MAQVCRCTLIIEVYILDVADLTSEDMKCTAPWTAGSVPASVEPLDPIHQVEAVAAGAFCRGRLAPSILAK